MQKLFQITSQTPPQKHFHDFVTPAHIAITVTHHTGDHPHIEVYQPTPEIVAGPDHTPCINQVRTLHLNSHPVPAGQLR